MENIITTLKDFITKHNRKIALFAAGITFAGCVVAGYVWASNKEAESRRGKATTSVSSSREPLKDPLEENPDYNADYVIIGDTLYVKPPGYEDYHINGMIAEGYKLDENKDLVYDSVDLVEVVRDSIKSEGADYSGYTYNNTTGNYEKLQPVNGKISIDKKPACYSGFIYNPATEKYEKTSIPRIEGFTYNQSIGKYVSEQELPGRRKSIR